MTILNSITKVGSIKNKSNKSCTTSNSLTNSSGYGNDNVQFNVLGSLLGGVVGAVSGIVVGGVEGGVKGLVLGGELIGTLSLF